MSVRIKASVIRNVKKNKAIRDKNTLKNMDRPENIRGDIHGKK